MSKKCGFLKSIFGVKSTKKGKMFDSNGSIKDSAEKTRYYVFSLPIFQKDKFIVNVNKFNLANKIAGGGGTLYDKNYI